MKQMTSGIAKFFVQHYPLIRNKVYAAQLPISPQEYMEKSLVFAFLGAFVFCFLFIVLFALSNLFLLVFLPVVFFVVSFFLIFFRIYALQGYIIKRKKAIDGEILFATRFLLIKIESGIPIFNAMSDVARGDSIGGKFFQEIITNVELGKPLEVALEETKNNTPSDKLRKLLRNILSTLETGADITQAMKNISKQITRDQFNEIKAYEKKLNSLSLFYLILAVVVPSLGMTMFLLISGFFNLTISNIYLIFFLFFLVLLQLFFLTIFKQVRPSIDL